MSTSEIHLFQIAYDAASRERVVHSDFLLLDNMDNARPDWYEYWPIRNYLLSHTLDDNDWYGFFSPKFCDKTQLGHAEVQNFVAEAGTKGASVALFSPQPDMGANFLNVFEQAELFDPGFLETAQSFVATLGLDVPLANLVMDSRQIVYSNYLVAKPAFWRTWFAWTEAMFAMAENSAHPLSASLCQPTSYGINAQRKVFLLERLAPLLLTLQPGFKTAEANSFNFGWSMARFRAVPEDSYINDALKRAFRDTGFPQYMAAFRRQREQFTGSSNETASPVVSIVVPTYRRAEKLRRALESVVGAVSTSHEVIVIDDCPDASGRAIAEQFGARYVHKAVADRGQSFSRNIGLEMAGGEWVAFLDDDDFFLPGGLDRLLKGAVGSAAAVVFGDYQAFNSIALTEVLLAQVNWDVLLISNQIPMGAFVIARRAIKRNFDTRMRSHEDWDFLLSNIATGGMAHMPGAVVAIDKSENQTTSTEARRRKLFWLDFLSIYARFPASHLASARETMLASLGVQMPPGLLQIDDVI